MFLTLAEWQAVRLTLLVAIVAVLASLPLAVALGWLLAKRNFPGKFLVDTIINLPLVLPPVVTGYLLLVTFGRQGYIGSFLERAFDVRYVFDWKGAALASAVVAFPLFVRPIRLAFSAIDDRLVQAARTLGARPLDAFWSILLPLARPGILSGSLLAFARSMGEFGATIMIAGNIPGETRTMSLLIYTQLDTPGGMEQSVRLVVASIVIAAVALAAGELLERYGRRRLQGPEFQKAAA
ncbi:MAG TPA: molybdate ABC transporter permease subunit [Pirellulales bacterium]|nr:molybdate ABC transporter permease subunit [Pirellulales bacterium]